MLLLNVMGMLNEGGIMRDIIQNIRGRTRERCHAKDMNAPNVFKVNAAKITNAHWVRTHENFSDICTKALGGTTFHDLGNELLH